MTRKPTKKAVEAATETPKEIVWSYGIRTWDTDGTAYNGFKWDLTVGARTSAPDWKAIKECGYGLHANKDGMEDWSLLNLSSQKKVGIIRWDSALEIDLDGKHKFPWAEIVAVEDYSKWPTIMALIAVHRKAAIERLTYQSVATGEGLSASAAGSSGHASAAGSSGHASAAGDSGHASAAGSSGHASAAGDYGHASAAGSSGIAASFGIEGQAKAADTGAIMLAGWKWSSEKSQYVLTHVFAGMVGQTYNDITIKPDTFYTLNDGQPVEVL